MLFNSKSIGASKEMQIQQYRNVLQTLRRTQEQ